MSEKNNCGLFPGLPPGQPVMRLVPMPADLNPSGDVFGGWVMAQVDIAGSIPARLVAKGRVATVAVNAFQFRQPVAMGDLVSIYADVVKIGRTSITVDVQVYATRLPHLQEPLTVKVTEATLTYVALNPDGSKRELPPQDQQAPLAD